MLQETLTFTNSRGESLTIGKQLPFVLQFIDGLGAVEPEIQTQKSPYQDGATYIDSMLLPRSISAQLFIAANNQQELYEFRNRLLRIFNPKFGLGTLTYNYGSGEKQIKAVPELAPVYPSGRENRSATFQTAMIELICPNPYWQDINPISLKLEDYVPNFKFPFKFPVKFSTRGDSRNLVNSGHVPTPVTVTFRGEAINPKITNQTTGQFIKINRTIPEGYELRITTAFNNKSAKIVDPDGIESNALGYLDLNSEFFSLEVGDNTLTFAAEGGRPEVYVEYRNWYVGV